MGYLFLLNKKHEKTRVSMGKSAKIIDHSMQAVGAVPIDKTEVPQPMLSEDNAFKELTDWENEDFVYVYSERALRANEVRNGGMVYGICGLCL